MYLDFFPIETSQNLFCGERRNDGDLNSCNEFQCRKSISTRQRSFSIELTLYCYLLFNSCCQLLTLYKVSFCCYINLTLYYIW